MNIKLSIVTINRNDAALFIMLFMIKSQIFFQQESQIFVRTFEDFFIKNRRFFLPF